MTKVRFAVCNADEKVKDFIRGYARKRDITMGQALDELVQHAQKIIESK